MQSPGISVPILREGELDIISNSPEQTARLGARLGKLLLPGDVVCLSGDMGAGKTVFSSGIGSGWGAKAPMTSPTYNIVHQHRRDADQTILYHLDCYRLRGGDEVETIGLDEMLESKGVILIEWAERIQDVLPAEFLWVELRVVEVTRRNFMMEGVGTRYQKLIEQFRSAVFGV